MPSKIFATGGASWRRHDRGGRKLTEELLYLYGVVPGDARVPPSAERGLEAGRVRLLELGQLSAVISRVRSDEYGEERLNERLRDLEWVGARGLEHEEVLQGLAAETTVLPLRPFSLHAGEDRLRDRLEPEVPRLVAILERLRGRGEWSLRMWRDGARLREALGRHSSRIRSYGGGGEGGKPGAPLSPGEEARAGGGGGGSCRHEPGGEEGVRRSRRCRRRRARAPRSPARCRTHRGEGSSC